jgi:BMFP domain-containing protein YqiC
MHLKILRLILSTNHANFNKYNKIIWLNTFNCCKKQNVMSKLIFHPSCHAFGANNPAKIKHIYRECPMKNLAFFDDLSIKIREMIKTSPAGDLEKNIHALLQSMFTKLELVSREEFDIQAEVLRQTREKLTALEKQIEAIEKRP